MRCYLFQSLTHACISVLRAIILECVKLTPHTIVLWNLGSLQDPLWPPVPCQIWGNIRSITVLSDLTLQYSLCVWRCLSALKLLPENVLLGTYKHTNPSCLWGILFQPRASLLPRGVSIMPCKSLSEKHNTTPFGFKMLFEIHYFLFVCFINNSCCDINQFQKTQPVESCIYTYVLYRIKRNRDMTG